MSIAVAREYLRLFNNRRAQCVALCELSRQQQRLIAAEEYSELVTLLGQKQQLLDHFRQVGQQYRQVFEQWPKIRRVLPADLERQCAAVLDDTEELLRELVTSEDAGTKALTSRREETQRALARLSQGADVSHAYADDAATAGRPTLNCDL